MEPGLYFFMVLVALLAFGLLWFRVLRPMAESFGWIAPYVETTNEQEYVAPVASSVYVTPRYDWHAGDADDYVKELSDQPGIKPSDTSINIGIRRFNVADIPPDLTYEEMVTIWEKQRTPAGKPTYSGKKIYSWVGGNYNDFCKIMRRLRAKDSEPAEEPDIFTPIAGRPTKASYFTDPDLVYEPPD